MICEKINMTMLGTYKHKINLRNSLGKQSCQSLIRIRICCYSLSYVHLIEIVPFKQLCRMHVMWIIFFSYLQLWQENGSPSFFQSPNVVQLELTGSLYYRVSTRYDETLTQNDRRGIVVMCVSAGLKTSRQLTVSFREHIPSFAKQFDDIHSFISLRGTALPQYRTDPKLAKAYYAGSTAKSYINITLLLMVQLI